MWNDSRWNLKVIDPMKNEKKNQKGEGKNENEKEALFHFVLYSTCICLL